MHRGATGDYESAATTGEPVRAFVPRPLPPDPALALGNSHQRLLERATLALGRLDSTPCCCLIPISFFMPTSAARLFFRHRSKVLNRHWQIYSSSSWRKVREYRLTMLRKSPEMWRRWSTA
jgi:hypothetical protein